MRPRHRRSSIAASFAQKNQLGYVVTLQPSALKSPYNNETREEIPQNTPGPSAYQDDHAFGCGLGIRKHMQQPLELSGGVRLGRVSEQPEVERVAVPAGTSLLMSTQD